MKFYHMTVGPSDDQTTLINLLKSQGGNVVQTSDGIFAAMPRAPELTEGGTVTEVDPEQDFSSLSKDAQTLISNHKF